MRKLLETDPRRSALMKRVRQRGTDPEVAVRQVLARIGARYRLNVRSLPGSPDIANRSRHIAIFVHGCFWHRHRNCAKTTTPKRNRAFWLQKFEANVERDARKIRALRRLGFRVLVVWECQVANPKRLETRLAKFWAGR